MPFIAPNGETEESTSRSVQALDSVIHYQEMGEGPPIVFLHNWGPGFTAWLTWYKVLPAFAKHFRCIAMDLPNYAKSGPFYYEDSVHNFQAKCAIALMDALSIQKAHIVGNSQGGQSAMALAYQYPNRVNKLVWGAGHIGQGAGYLITSNSEEGIRVGMQAELEPTVENVRRFLETQVVDKSLVTDEIIQYLIKGHARGDLAAARAAVKPPAVRPDHGRGILSTQAETLVIWGRDDRTCTFELGIQALNLTPKAELVVLKATGSWAPYEKPEQYASYVLNFLLGHERYSIEKARNS